MAGIISLMFDRLLMKPSGPGDSFMGFNSKFNIFKRLDLFRFSLSPCVNFDVIFLKEFTLFRCFITLA